MAMTLSAPGSLEDAQKLLRDRAESFDPFEVSINSAIQRVEALRAVRNAKHAVERAKIILAAAEAEALKVGAYDMLPAEFRPGGAS